MKKAVLIVLLLTAVFVGTASAEADFTAYSPAFDDGDMAIQLGLSLLSTLSITGNTVIPPISVGFDYAVPISDLPFSFGGIVGVAMSRFTFFSVTDTYTYILAAARAAYHVDLDQEKIDTYVGILLGINYFILSTDNPFVTSNTTGGSVLAGGYVGGRYFFSDSLAAFVELGYGLGYFTGGLAFKL